MYYTEKKNLMLFFVFQVEMVGKNAFGNQSKNTKYEYDDHYRMNHSIIT